jgi:hypothetical protein
VNTKPPPAPDLVTITRDHVLACRCGDRSWTNKAVSLLAGNEWIGSNGMLIRGWLSAAIGRKIPLAHLQQALAAKSRAWLRKHPQADQLEMDMGDPVATPTNAPAAPMKAGPVAGLRRPIWTK